ncbi:MAG: CBS domain-containing protein [Desulfobacterales bacterium]|nr:CBS domain-containing protein [Desulfobacterales bacterium]
MIPDKMKAFLEEALPESVRKNRRITDGPFCFLEFGPLDVDRLQRLGIRVDRLGPRLVVCMWDRESESQIGGYLVVDNLAMGQPSMGGTRMLPDITPDIIHNLARGMTLKNAAADLPFGGGKSGIVCPDGMDDAERHDIVRGFGRLLKRYKDIYIPGPDVGTNDADMKTFAIENGLNNVVSKPADMGGNRIDELGGAANGVVVAFKALLEHMPRLRQLPQFRNMDIPEEKDLDILIQGFGAVGAHVARIFHEYAPGQAPLIKGISDATGYLLNRDGLPWQQLFDMWQTSGVVARDYYHEHIMHGETTNPGQAAKTIFSNSADNLLTESAFCLVPASPVFNYLDVNDATGPSMTTDRMGNWRVIVEGANTYSPNPARKSERRRMERHVYRDKGILIATDYLVNSGGVIYAAHERMIPTPDHLFIPKDLLGHPNGIQEWLNKNGHDFQVLAEQRRKAAVDKLETVIRRNMEELVDGLCRDADSLPCEIAEKISIQRIAAKEKSRTARDVMAEAPTISLDKSIADAADLLVDSHLSIVTVVSEKGKLIGIVTNWDITRATALKLPMDAPLTKIMTADVVYTGPEATILECIRMLEHHEISAMPIVEDNQVVGIVSGDILARRTLFRLLQTM